MVDAIVSFVVNKLGNALIHELVFLDGFRGQVEELRDELRRMQCFLKDADAKQQQGDERVRNWVADIRDVAYDAEDVIDTFLLKVEIPGVGGMKTFFLGNPFIWKHLHKIGNEIQAILARIKVISNSRITYGISNLSGGENSRHSVEYQRFQQLRRSYPHFDDEGVIGLVEHTEALLAELMKEDKRRRVISIVGIGGLGKTTLAKKIYRHDYVKSHFDFLAWGFISQQYNRRDLLQEILKKATTLTDHEMEKICEGDLVVKLHDYLQEKRYLVVLDDIWSSDVWDTISPSFPNGKIGSKVLVTTRKKEVALHADHQSLHLEPQLLTDEEGWILVCMKLFPRSSCPPSLEKLGRVMVQKCGGLPLGIVVLGGLLAAKKLEIKEWEFVHRNIMAHMNNDHIGGVSAILSLSYNDLPFHLKPCFLYLGLFPEDYAIQTKKLIQLWIAEGFIPQMEHDSLVTMDDVGKHQYLEELSQRCMLKVDKSAIPGEGTTCRLHDLMRDLCLSKAKEVNFLDIYDQQHHVENRTVDCFSSAGSYRRLRRYAFHLVKEQQERYECYFENLDCALRTLLVDVPECFDMKPFDYRNIKLLRILDLECVTQMNKNITKQVSKLIHLRYLALGGQPDMPISPSIGRLRNLQTLKLVNFGGCLPETTSRMLQLRHLSLSDCCEIDEKFIVDNLINLHTLENIPAGKWIRNGCFEKLINLRRLWINNLSRLQAQVILTEVVAARMGSLSSAEQSYHNPIKSLELHCKEEFPRILTHSLTVCCNLRVLCLSGTLSFHEKLFPPSLTKLYLQNNMLAEDPMAVLQDLPNLKVLILSEAYAGVNMRCSAIGFPRLQHLYLLKHNYLVNIFIDHGGMPCLKVLHISDCKQLWMLPIGLRSISTLKDLLIISMPSRFTARLVKTVGKDWFKIRHIPSIRVVDA